MLCTVGHTMRLPEALLDTYKRAARQIVLNVNVKQSRN